MKQIITSILLTSLLFACKHQPRTPEVNPDSVEVAIPLSTGGIDSKAGNRDNTTGFEAGEKVGITAYFSKRLTPDMTNVDDVVDFTVAPHFSNALAVAGGPDVTDPTAVWNELVWQGPTQNPALPRFYPQGKNIHLYAYYPYSDGVTATEGVKFLGSKSATPYGAESIEVKLSDETITDQSGTITQPDVLVSNQVASINRDTPIDDPKLKLTFNHLLSQVQFKVKKHENVVGTPSFVSLIFTVPGKANFAVAAPGAYTDLSLTEDDKTVYSITKGFDIKGANEYDVLAAPIMTLPYTLADLQKCTLKLVVRFGTYGEQEFNVALTGDNGLKKEFTQGGLNIIKLNISRVQISLTSTITPWVTGTTNEIPVE